MTTCMSDNRLEEVYKAFTSYDRLVYFHNSQTIIDGNGNVLERPPPYPLRTLLEVAL